MGKTVKMRRRRKV
jgi:hypothetical protein